MSSFLLSASVATVLVVLSRTAWAQDATAPSGELGFGALLLKTALVLLLICVLAWIFLRFLALPFFRGRTAVSRGRMQLLEQLRFDTKRNLAIVRVGQRHFLLGITEGAIHTLAELNETDVAGAPTQATGLVQGRLENWLQSALGKKDSSPKDPPVSLQESQLTGSKND